MVSEDKRQTELSSIHPAIRERLKTIKAELNKLGFPFEIFEAYRSPQRQAYLYAQGRDRPGNIVTKAVAWSSYHQYGLAADFVLKTNGNWDWSSSGGNSSAWEKLHEIGRKNGMEPLSWELPHLQMAGLNISDLRAGRYPPDGDESWATNLEASIVSWLGSESAPPPPKSVSRPAIDTDESDTVNATRGGGQVSQLGAEGVAMGSFEKVHALIEKWEGGYTNHPKDPGGPTNMGITQKDLAEWRAHPVSAEDVRNLTRDEALLIFKMRYWTPLRGDELPLPAAQVVYNTCVLSGRGRAVRILQEALGVTVDGAIGTDTLRAAQSADQGQLVQNYCALYEAYLRSLPIFSTFGRGWMNRLTEVKSTALNWASGADDTMVTRAAAQTTTDSVSFGDSGARVTALQEVLVKTGYSVGEIDGIFGTLTRAALLAYQADNNIPTTGVADSGTWAALDHPKPRPLSPDRVTATAEDLREKGSETVQAADKTKLAALVSTVLGALGIGNSTIVQIANNLANTVPATPLNPGTVQSAIQQCLVPGTNPSSVDKITTAIQQLKVLDANSILSPTNFKILQQLRDAVPSQCIDAVPAIKGILAQIDSLKPQIQTIFDVLPGFFASESTPQLVSKGLALAATSIIPGLGGSLAALGIGLAANYFGNKIIKARVQDHATAANTDR